MSNWFEELAQGWPMPNDNSSFGSVYEDLESAWQRGDLQVLVWLAARLAPGWPERRLVVRATARAIAVLEQELQPLVEFPLDRVPDIAGWLGEGTELESPERLREMGDMLDHAGTVGYLVEAKVLLARAWLAANYSRRRTEEQWRATALELCTAAAKAVAARRVLGPVRSPRHAHPAFVKGVTWVVLATK